MTPAVGQMETADLLLLVGAIIAVTMVMISLRRRSADRGSSPRAYAREQLAKFREQDEVRDDMAELMMQLEKLAREINAQVDTKFAKLEKAIADADARLAELRRMGVGEAGTEPDAPSSAPEGTESDRTLSPETGTLEEGASDVPTDAAALEPPEPTEDRDSFQRQVLELTDAGKTPVEIARQLGRDVGEVELMINLNRRGKP